MLHFTLLYSTLLYSTLLYSTLLYSTLQYSTLHLPSFLFSSLLFSSLHYSTLFQLTNTSILFSSFQTNSDLQEKLILANKQCDDLRELKMNNNEKNIAGKCRPIVAESWTNFGSGSTIRKDGSYQSSDSDRLYDETVRNSDLNSNLSLNSNSNFDFNKANNSVDSQDYFNYNQYPSGSLKQSHLGDENENENENGSHRGDEEEGNEDEELFDDVYEYDYNEGEEEEKGERRQDNYPSNYNSQIVNNKENQHLDNDRLQEQHQYQHNPQSKHTIQIQKMPTNIRQENKSIPPNHQGTDNSQNFPRNIPQINPKIIPKNVPRKDLDSLSQSGYQGRLWIVEDSGEINSHHHSQQHTQSESQQHTQGQGQRDGRSRHTESMNNHGNNNTRSTVTVTTPHTQPCTPAMTQSQHPPHSTQDNQTALTSTPTPLKRNETKNQIIRKKIWTKYFDPVTELDYYHNRSTKVTTWEAPSSQEMELFMP